MGVPELRNYDDLARHAVEVRDRGFRALKTNILPMVDGKLSSYVPGFGRTAGLAGAELGQPADARRDGAAGGDPRRGRARTWGSISISTSTSRPRGLSASPRADRFSLSLLKEYRAELLSVNDQKSFTGYP